MKREFVKFTNTYVWWSILIGGIMTIVLFSIAYYRSGTKQELFWTHGVQEYNSREELLNQIDECKELVQLYGTLKSPEGLYYQQTSQILEYLCANGIAYDEAMEVDSMDVSAFHQMGYATEIARVIYILTMAGGVAVICLIISLDKSSGKCYLLFMMKKRKEVVYEKTCVVILAVGMLISSFFLLVFLIGGAFPETKSIMIFYSSLHGVTGVNTQAYYLYMLMSLVFKIAPIVLACIGVAWLVDNLVVSVALQIVICGISFVGSMVGPFVDYFNILNWFMCNIPASESTYVEHIGANILVYVVTVSFCLASVRRMSKKNICV